MLNLNLEAFHQQELSTMSEDVNVFMDPFLNIYTHHDHIAIADNIVEAFQEDAKKRDQLKEGDATEKDEMEDKTEVVRETCVDTDETVKSKEKVPPEGQKVPCLKKDTTTNTSQDEGEGPTDPQKEAVGKNQLEKPTKEKPKQSEVADMKQLIKPVEAVSLNKQQETGSLGCQKEEPKVVKEGTEDEPDGDANTKGKPVGIKMNGSAKETGQPKDNKAVCGMDKGEAKMEEGAETMVEANIAKQLKVTTVESILHNAKKRDLKKGKHDNIRDETLVMRPHIETVKDANGPEMARLRTFNGDNTPKEDTQTQEKNNQVKVIEPHEDTKVSNERTEPDGSNIDEQRIEEEINNVQKVLKTEKDQKTKGKDQMSDGEEGEKTRGEMGKGNLNDTRATNVERKDEAKFQTNSKATTEPKKVEVYVNEPGIKGKLSKGPNMKRKAKVSVVTKEAKENEHHRVDKTKLPYDTSLINDSNELENKDFEDHIYVEPDDFKRPSPEEVKVKEQLKSLDNVTLHIAVTGMTGAGKSTFINAIRGLANDDEGAAPTGVTETTMKATEYPHPTMPNVKFWDLPGTGSPKFKAKKYLKEVQLDKYDFFIIITSERFKENDIMLAEEIKRKNKLFYFLRSKIDNDIRAEEQRKGFEEHKVLSKIKEDCQKNLMDLETPKVFLISSFQLAKYDFQKLIDTLERELPEHKKEALILSLPIYSTDILEKKIETFRKATWTAAVASAAVAVLPIPGLSVACDASILLAFFTKCYYAFGLDDGSLDKLSERVNNNSLKSLRESPLVRAIGKKELSRRELSALVNREAVVEFAWSIVPGYGSATAASMSHSATLQLLQTGLEDLADTARKVLKVAGLYQVF